MENLTTATPVEIDTALAEIYDRRFKAQQRSQMIWGDVKMYAKQVLGMTYRQSPTAQQVRDVCAEAVETREADASSLTYRQRDLLRYLDQYEALQVEIEETYFAEQPLDDEYVRRGRWTRAFLVRNSNGHVHSSMSCSTCFPTTWYQWRTEFSGATEAEVVEAAGERACTVCYPSAPVETLSRPTRMFTPEEVDAQQKREERAAKKAAAQAEQVVVPDFPHENFRTSDIRTEEKVFKTLRAATQAASSARADVLQWNGSHPMVPLWEMTAEAVERALAAKTGTPLAEVQADIAKRAAATAKRRG